MPLFEGELDPLDAVAVESAAKKWTEQLEAMAAGGRAGKAIVTTVVTNQMASFFNIRATFTRKHFAAEEPLQLEVHVRFASMKCKVRMQVTVVPSCRYVGPEPLQLTGVSAALNNAAYLPYCQVQYPERAEELFFQPGQVRCYAFGFTADPQDVGGELQISSVSGNEYAGK